MLCSNCGKEIDEDSKFCEYCGKAVWNDEFSNLQDDNTESELINLSEKPENKEDKVKKPFYKKKRYWIIGILFIWFIWAWFNVDDTETKMEDTSEQVEFTTDDLEELVGIKEDELEEKGLKKKESSTYQALEGNVQVTCTAGAVTEIILKGDEEKTPDFYGIHLGTGETEATEKIVEFYPEKQEDTHINLEKKGKVKFGITEGKVTSITYQTISDDEIVQYKKQKEDALRAEYIFPDSDKKYLSEDEVRSQTVDKLYIGRNEIFARHGYIFEDESLQQHFGNTSWYNGTVTGEQFNADAVFNDFEKKNVELIKRIEDEINGPSEEEIAQQAAIDGAYNAVVGRKFHLQDAQRTIEFTAGGEFVYSISSFANNSCAYDFTARYEIYKDDIYEWMVYVNIAGVEYYFRYFNNGTINLSGAGEFDGWYEPL